jgi:hypothetical protein
MSIRRTWGGPVERGHVSLQLSWPSYLVTARHTQTPAAPGLASAPWGTWHARRDGCTTTACGEPVTSWKTFWHLRFDDAGVAGCRQCAIVVKQDTKPADRGH